ncbi:DEAD/DEAH box helicase, partial [Clostridium perfringens]
MNKAIEVLEKYFGYNSFREGQSEIISNILRGRDSFCIMPTGGGKSICYQIPALILNGITLVISPLISLMKDQVDSINDIGIKAEYINSTQSLDEINEILKRCYDGEVKLLYIAPERLESEYFN